jgi:hypothetical protein
MLGRSRGRGGVGPPGAGSAAPSPAGPQGARERGGGRPAGGRVERHAPGGPGFRRPVSHSERPGPHAVRPPSHRRSGFAALLALPKTRAGQDQRDYRGEHHGPAGGPCVECRTSSQWCLSHQDVGAQVDTPRIEPSPRYSTKWSPCRKGPPGWDERVFPNWGSVFSKTRSSHIPCPSAADCGPTKSGSCCSRSA